MFHIIDYPTYLEKAMSLFDSNYEFLIFSDDPSLIKKKIDLRNFIDLKNVNEVEDLFALSQCDSIIMSNSSFLNGGEVGSVNQKKLLFLRINGLVPKAQKIMMTDLVRIGLRFKQVDLCCIKY